MYGVYSRAITKGRNNPDPNIEDLICVRSNQWCIRTQDSIKCKKLYTGLDRRILTCYNNTLYPGIAKLVSRLVWENTTSRIKNSITGCSAVGSAPALGAGCRRFESCHSDHLPSKNRQKRRFFCVKSLFF